MKKEVDSGICFSCGESHGGWPMGECYNCGVSKESEPDFVDEVPDGEEEE